MIGAAPEQLEDLARHMRAAASQLETLRRDVDGMLNRLIWDGRDADFFNEQWLGHLSASIIAVESMLDDSADSLVVNAHQQREASGDYGGSAVGVIGGIVASGGAAFDILHWLPQSKLFGSTKLAQFSKDTDRVLSDVPWRTAVDDAMGKVSWMKSVDGVLSKNHLTGVADELLRGHLSTDVLGTAGDAVGVVLNGWSFVHDLNTDRSAPDTYNKGVDTAIGIAVLVAAAAPVDAPVVAAIAAGGLLYDGVAHFDPNLGKQVVGGVVNAGKAVVHVEEDELKVADVAARAVSSGVRGALSLIHL